MFRVIHVLILLLVLAPPAFGDYLEVRRSATLKVEPESNSEIILRREVGSILLLAEDDQSNGYYLARTETGTEGWIYRTLVRRYAGDPPVGWGDTSDDDGAHVGMPEYDRDDWRHWRDHDGDCQDARQEVLIAESTVPVAFESGNDCRVETGEWICAFTGETFTDPGDLDVDHMVPLANAHASGAWAWDDARREAYANDLVDAEHLIAVRASANRSKGARGPDEWMPPDEDHWCDYARNWIAIKERWALTMTVAEMQALNTMLATCEE